MKISPHVSYKEATYSETATRNDIDNEPNAKQLLRIKVLCDNLFESLRDWVNGPIKINSCFRSEELNTRIGGASSSQHMANNGAAMDIDDTYGYRTNAEMFFYIKDNLEFDQMIWEFGDDDNPDWVHVSYNRGDNRGQILKACKVDGRTKYLTWG
jgi:hypothetical protein